MKTSPPARTLKSLVRRAHHLVVEFLLPTRRNSSALDHALSPLPVLYEGDTAPLDRRDERYLAVRLA